jgi:SNF2 family DNA or RNA helicase
VTVDIQHSKIILIPSNNELGSIHRSQLSFWDFTFDYSQNLYTAPLDQQLFLKVTRYFAKEGIVFYLEDTAKKYSEKLAVTTLNFENLKRTAALFKEGQFDKIQFDEFRKFTASNIKRSLKIHQLKAAFHLYLLGNGANFSVPGSGKTSVVLTVFEKLKQEEKVNTLFVVGPPSSFGPWKNEFRDTLGRNPRTIILAGGNKKVRQEKYHDGPAHKAELYLTTFHSLLSDQKDVTHFLSQKYTKAFFVVDEAHYIKQIKGNWAQAILKQSEKANFRCVLTGTPMPKSYTDVFNLFDFLWPNQHPIPSNNKTMIKINEERGTQQNVKSILKENIGPLFYRVRKSDLNLKPQNLMAPEVIEMNSYEQMIYDAIFTKIKNYSKESYYSNIEFVNKLARGRIIRLRQAVSYAKLLNTAIDDYNEKLLDDKSEIKRIISQYDKLEVPAKITHLLSKIADFQKRKLKVVIWTNFIETINLIEHQLKQKKIRCKKIYGATPVEGNSLKDEETREKIRDEFVDPDSGLDVLIANPAACAESISLHKTCHNAIYYDLSYNCAQYLQSLDRIHRVGGSETVEANYYFLQYRNTIDVDIKRNIDRKTKKMYEIVEEDYAIYSLNMSDPDDDAEAYKRLFMKTSKGKEKKK